MVRRHAVLDPVLALVLLASCVLGTAVAARTESARETGEASESVACGESWQVVTPQPTPNSLSGVAWTGTRFVAVGKSGTILTSPDAATWTSHSWTPTVSLAAVTWTGTQLVAVGTVGTIITSPDGVTWTSHNWRTPIGLTGVVWNGTQIVAVGFNGTILTSADGIAWSSRYSPTVNTLLGVAWTGSQLVAVGASGTILTSPDGVTWTLRTSGTQVSLTGASRTVTQLVVVGAGGTVLTSSDGSTWAPRSSGVTSQLNAVVWTGTQLVAAGGSGAVLTSADGITWTSRSSGVSSQLNAVVWTGTGLVAVGDAGTVIISSCPPPCSPPSITSQPQGREIPSGTTATLSVTATGTPPLAYQWYQGASGTTSHPVGTNASTFTTPALTAATPYWVRVTNGCGQSDSATATVTIACVAPAITTHPRSLSVTRGQSVTLAVSATGTAPLSYQWYEGRRGDISVPVGTNSRMFITPEATRSTSYWARVSNACGHADSVAASLIVTMRPRRFIRRASTQ